MERSCPITIHSRNAVIGGTKLSIRSAILEPISIYERNRSISPMKKPTNPERYMRRYEPSGGMTGIQIPLDRTIKISINMTPIISLIILTDKEPILLPDASNDRAETIQQIVVKRAAISPRYIDNLPVPVKPV